MKRKKNLESPKRKVYVTTNYGSVEIVNLKHVWINNFLGTWNLMYEDDIYSCNCIYWNFNNPQKLENLKKQLIQAYNNGDTIIELL